MTPLKRLFLALMLFLPTAVHAGSTDLSIQGMIFDDNDDPLEGAHDITFRIYDAEEGGTALWEETYSVEFADGVYVAALEGIADSVFEDNDELFVGVQIGSDGEMVPRLAVYSSAFARFADLARDIADGVVTAGKIADGAIQSDNIAAGAVGSNELASSGVTAGTYTLASITVDADGRITSASDGVAGAGDITGVNAGTGMTGGGSSGDVTLNVSLGTDIISGEIVDGTITANDISNTAGITDAQVSDTLTVGASGSVSDSALSANVSLLGAAISSAEITDNDVSASDLAAALTFADSDLINLAAVNASSATEGLILPQANDVSAATAEGQISWDADNDALYIGTGAAVSSIGNPFGAAIDTGEITDGTIASGDINANAALTDNQVSDTITVGASGSVNDSALSANVSLLGPSIASAEITDNDVSASDLAAALTFADGDLLNLAAVNASGTAEGLILPQANNVTAATAEGQISWDADNDTLYVGDGSAVVSMGNPFGAAIDSAEITDNTVTASDLNATLTFADSDLVDMSSINASSTTEGLRLPQAASVSGATAEGQIAWDTDNNTLYVGTGTAQATIATTLTAQPNMMTGRRFGFATFSNNAQTILTFAGGMSGSTCGGQTATAAPTATGATRFHSQMASGTSDGTSCGGYATGSQTYDFYRPKFSASMLTNASLTDTRTWVGMSSGTNTNLTQKAPLDPASGSVDSAVAWKFVGVAFDTDVDATPNWLCCSGQGSGNNPNNESCEDTGVPVATSTEYTISVDWSTANTLVCTVNGTSVTKTTDIPVDANTEFGYTAASTTLATASVNFLVSKIMLEQN